MRHLLGLLDKFEKISAFLSAFNVYLPPLKKVVIIVCLAATLSRLQGLIRHFRPELEKRIAEYHASHGEQMQRLATA